MNVHYVIGCGGIGCWLVPLLKKMLDKTAVISVMDGDKIEQRNFDRQFHSMENLGWNKAEALFYQYGLNHFYPRYLSRYSRPPLRIVDWVWCCVDNHPARLECLEWIDENASHGIFGGNEYESSQSFIYFSNWKDTDLDPRKRYPEILTDKRGNPDRPNCQGEAQIADPQLAVYNYLAAGGMMHLYCFWLHYSHLVSRELWAIQHEMALGRFQTFNAVSLNRSNEPIHIVPLSGEQVQDSEDAI